MNYKVDVCITTYRNADKLKICLNTVIERTKFIDYKVIVWVNDPNDEVKQIIHDSMYLDGILFNDKIVPIFNDTNDGSFSSNNNEAASEGESEYILFMNDDVEPIHENWLYSMAQILDTDPKVGAVGALLLYPNQTIQHCGVFFSHKTNNLPFHIHYKQPANKVTDFISVPRYYQAVTAACMLVRRADFNSVGGFDTNYFYGFEDVDLCLKLKEQLGKYCVYCPVALVHHEGISSITKKDSHPKLQENIKVLREKWTGKYINDLDFYLRDPKFMVYKIKPPVVLDEEDQESEIEE
jgi:GT2 family glycosyltransferase